jgi:hypothetical protein
MKDMKTMKDHSTKRKAEIGKECSVKRVEER